MNGTAKLTKTYSSVKYFYKNLLYLYAAGGLIV